MPVAQNKTIIDSPILQTNPKASYLARKDEIDEAIRRVLDSGWYILGKEVAAFEQEFAAYVGVAHAVGVASGTDAIVLALRAAGVGAGDLVFTVSHTAVATVAAVELCGARPVYVDIDPVTFTMEPARLETALQVTNGRAKAVLPVHLYGQTANMTAIGEIARRHGLILIEDCSQAHGARWNGQMAGTFGHLATFSFYPTKNLGALGDGGAVVTSDAALAEQVRLLREYGWKERYVSAVPGTNSRLDEIQAAILRAKLPSLDSDNARRREIACAYHRLLADSALDLPQTGAEATHVFHQYVIRTTRRDELRAYLRAAEIGTLIHYPVPVHLQPAYAHYATLALPETESAAREVLSLPLYPELPLEAVEAVAVSLRAWELDRA